MTGQPVATGLDRAPSYSFASRVVKSGGWVVGGKVARRGLQAVRLIVLGRLLVPEDFGLFGIVTLALAAMETLTQTGFQVALIQRQAGTEDYLDTAWTVQVVRGFVLAGILFAGAPLLVWLFGEPRVVRPLRVVSAIEVLRGFVNIGIIYLQKEMRFEREVAYQFLSSVVAFVVGIALAWWLRNVWALVWASVAEQAARTFFSYVFHPYRPCVKLDRAEAGELFAFGRWILGSAIILFVATRFDQVVLGRVLGAGALGVYALAHQIADLPATEVTHVASVVMIPAYAKLQGDRRRLGNAFIQVFELIMSMAIPLTAFLVVAAPQIILGLLGAQWEQAIVPLRILAVAGLLRAVNATGGPLFIGAGRPQMDFWMNLGRASVIATATYPLTRWFGLSGTAAAVVLALAVTLPVWARVRCVGSVSWLAVGRSLAHGGLLGALVVVAVAVARHIGPNLSAFGLLVLEGGMVLLLCGVAVLLIGHWFNRGLAVIAVKAWRAMHHA